MTPSEEIKRRLERREEIKKDLRKLTLEEKTNDKIIKLLEQQVEEEKESSVETLQKVTSANP